jgi:hypothetical protein
MDIENILLFVGGVVIFAILMGGCAWVFKAFILGHTGVMTVLLVFAVVPVLCCALLLYLVLMGIAFNWLGRLLG